MDKLSRTTSIIYGFILFAGGVMGYVKANSEISLIMGTVSGIAILWSCYSANIRPKFAYLIVISISILLALSFSIRLAVTKSFFPTGFMLIVSSTSYVLVSRGWIKSREKTR